MIDTPAVHSYIASHALDYLRDLFGAENVKKAGEGRWRVGKRGSKAISIKGDVMVFYCHESGQGGDAIELWRHVYNVGIGDAMKGAAAWAHVTDDGTSPEPTRKKRKPKAKPIPPPVLLNAEQIEEAASNIMRLANDHELCERIATARKWMTVTIRNAALDGALGWSDGWKMENGHQMHRGALVFIYPSGLKHRWKQGEQRMIRWRSGKPETLWRASAITNRTRRIFLTEGETDCISLLDAGMESSRDVAVCALPNAGVIPPLLTTQLAGLDVVLCLDHDDAGARAKAKLIKLLAPHAKSLQEWGGAR